MAEVAYNVGKSLVAANAIPNAASNLRAAIVITSKTGAADPDLATMAAIDAVGTVAFHTQRVALASVTKTTDNTNDRVNWSCATFSFSAAAGVTALALIVYDATTDTNDTTRIPIAFYDTNFGAGIAMDGGLNVTVPTNFLQLA